MNFQHAKKKKLAELRLAAKLAFRNYQAGQISVILDEWPGQEFFRCIQDITPVSYVELWENAGGKLLEGGRMIALKNEPIWLRVSRFGLPYPPFDEYDVMWIRDVDRTEAERLGLISRSQKIQPQIRNWADDEKCIR